MNIELQMTEANSVYTTPGKQSVSLVNGLFMADMIGQISRSEFKACMWWDLRSGSDANQNNSPTLYGWRNFGTYGVLANGDRGDTPLNTRFPTFYAAKLLTHWGRHGDANPDQDGSANLLEYALALEPKTASLLGLPVMAQESVNGETHTTFTFTQPRVIGDITYTVQVSTDLKTWSSGPGHATRTDDGSTDQATFRVTSARSENPRQFVRLLVANP